LQAGVVLRASCAAAGLLCSTAFAQIQEGVWIPAPGGYTVAATILRPEGAGPFGAVILNHGVPVSDKERAGASPTDLLMSAAVFAQRGYVVVLPLRRGFGATGGEFAEYTGSCSHPDYLGGEQAAAEDVMAAYEYTRALPYVDPHRMILAGHSAGGMVAVFTAGMRQPEGLVAVLAFAAGRGGNPALHPGVPCAAEPLARVLDMVGRSIKAPVMFHYAENDQYFNPDTTRFWFKRFTASGARAEYVLQPPFGEDGHYVFGDLTGIRYWAPAVESFLAKYNVPFQRLDTSATLKR
jgi:dienelactone hydrolase